jgi:hypothetical protein
MKSIALAMALRVFSTALRQSKVRAGTPPYPTIS